MASGADATVPKEPLHILFFPLMCTGHIRPMVGMAHLFANRGVRSTLVTTPADAAVIRPTFDSAAASGHPLHLVVVSCPSPDLTGFSPGQERANDAPATQFIDFITALYHLRQPLDTVLNDLRPDCIVSDFLLPWTADLADEHGLPRLTFHGPGAFPLYVYHNVPGYFHLADADGSFTMDGLPHRIWLHKKAITNLIDYPALFQHVGEAESKSYGVVVNTYREMEPAYVDLYKGLQKTWCVGPVSLCYRREDEQLPRSGILAWLDAQLPGSVVYVCFGTLCHFGRGQLREIAAGLVASERPFVWVVREEGAGDWMPEGFETTVEGRGLVVREWVPQVAVLAHPAVGWFVTHCGWNSLLEAVCARVPMVTWPLDSDQFINQELLVEVMGVGVRMWEGFRRNQPGEEEVLVTAEEIAAVLARVARGGEQVDFMKQKLNTYGEAARKAVEEGGSSYADITDLIEHIEARKKGNVLENKLLEF